MDQIEQYQSNLQFQYLLPLTVAGEALFRKLVISGLGIPRLLATTATGVAFIIPDVCKTCISFVI